MYSFFYLEPVCCSMSSSNCCFLICIQISQEVDQVVWYSHLFQNFPLFIVIHTVKDFGIVNKAEIDGFFWTLLLFPCFCQISTYVSCGYTYVLSLLDFFPSYQKFNFRIIHRMGISVGLTSSPPTFLLPFV